MQLRLDKFLAELGAGSRQEAKALIKKGRITIDGETVRRPEIKVDSEKNTVCLDGRELVYYAFEYFMLNKPAGVISATTDPRQKTVLDLITEKTRKDLFPVGRLDKDTVGLLLITNDGKLSHRLLSPARHVDKQYFAKLLHPVTPEDQRAFAEGIDIGDEDKTLPAKLEIPDSQRPSEALVTIHEGRFHQIKRMFEARGNTVIYLKRLSMGPLKLDANLGEGESRRLSKEEVQALLDC